MRLLLAGIAMVMLLATGCKKDTVNHYYLQADINGVNESFNSDAFAQEYLGDITASFSITGNNTVPQHRLFISILHTYNRTVTTGTYDKHSVDSLYIPGLAYAINDTITYGSGVNLQNPYPVSITVSALTNTTATGLFSGIVYNPQNPADSIVVTNGKFYLPLKH